MGEQALPESEGTLLERAVGGDKAAFSALYDQCLERVYRHVYYHVASREEAEDITQDTFTRAWKSIGRYRPTGAPFLSWLLAIARNLMIDHHRRRRTTVPLEEIETLVSIGDDPALAAEASFDWSDLRLAVLKLKGDRQRVIVMRFVDGFSNTEIAKALNKREGAVRMLLSRALDDLRTLVNRDAHR